MKALLAAALLMSGSAAFAQEQDSRGIPVENAEANVPAGANVSVTVPPGAEVRVIPASQVFVTRQATAPYPACERGQTDRCTQTYEGRPRARRR